MPTYTIKDTQTGRTLKVQGDSPPTDEEAEQLFASQSQPAQAQAQTTPNKPAFVPEMVAGTPEQMQAARARNLQGQLGLQEPVSPDGHVPIGDRFWSSFAPTKEEQQAYYEAKYGKGSFVPVTANTALVRVSDGKGGKQWVVDNPKGLDFGDVAALAGAGPELLSGMVSAASVVPNPAQPVMSAAKMSGLAAAASNAAGALEDIAYRYFTGTPVNLAEIGERRGIKTLADTALGTAVAVPTDKLMAMAASNANAKNFLKPFMREGDLAKERLVERGINPPNAAMLGDAVRDTQAATMKADDAGNAIASVLTHADKALRGEAEAATQKAAQNLSTRAQADLAATMAPAADPIQTGLAASGAIKRNLQKAQSDANAILQDALKDISEATSQGRGNKAFIDLEKTRAAVKDLEDHPLITDTGEVADIQKPLQSKIAEINQFAGTPQEIIALRNFRSQLGAKIGGQADVFPGLDAGVAKKLYQAISSDIDTSVEKLTGPGAQKLRDYNAAYKALLGPTETNPLLSKIASGGFAQPEDIINQLAKGGSDDWKFAKQYIDPDIMPLVRRGVMNNILGGAEKDIAGQKVADLGALSARINAIKAQSGEGVLNDMFGSSAAWKAIQKHGDELNYLDKNKGLFTSPKLPPMDDLIAAIDTAKSKGYDAANSALKDALDIAQKRRANIAESLVSLARAGATEHVTQDPARFFETVVLDGKHGNGVVKDVLGRLTEGQREEMGRTAFQTLFDRARDATASTVARSRNTYDLGKILESTFGGNNGERMEMVLGPDRFNLLKDYTSYMAKLAIAEQGKQSSARNMLGLIAVAPYHNLFAARATALALEKSAGRAFISGATPEASQLFAEARQVIKNPQRTGAGIAILQKAMNAPGYGDYFDMMKDLTPEQQDAVDEFLTPRKN